MSQYFQHWKELFDALSLRERAIISAACLAIMIIAWDAGLMQQLYVTQKASAAKIEKLAQQISDIDKKTHDLTERLIATRGDEGKKRIGELKIKLTALSKKQEKLAVQFIRPKQMVQVLKGMLAQEKGLLLTRLESASVKPLFRSRPGRAKGIATMEIDELTSLYKQGKAKHGLTVPQADVLSGDELKREQALARKRPQVFKHAVELEFQGDYRSTLRYLKNLENLPWRFYWDGVSYEVIKYPKASITINIYTLSLDKGWMGV